MRLKIGIDIGGTFTDVALIDQTASRLVTCKVPTTPGQPAVGCIEGVQNVLAEVRANGEDVRSVIHGTTLVTNMLVERTGARVGLLTTEGFRDVLEARSDKRYDLYDLAAELPDPLVPRRLRMPVRERIDANGEIVRSLDESQAEGRATAGRGWRRGNRGLPPALVSQ